MGNTETWPLPDEDECQCGEPLDENGDCPECDFDDDDDDDDLLEEDEI